MREASVVCVANVLLCVESVLLHLCSMLELRSGMERVLAARKQRGASHSLMVEYVLLHGVNDSVQVCARSV